MHKFNCAPYRDPSPQMQYYVLNPQVWIQAITRSRTAFDSFKFHPLATTTSGAKQRFFSRPTVPSTYVGTASERSGEGKSMERRNDGCMADADFCMRAGNNSCSSERANERERTPRLASFPLPAGIALDPETPALQASQPASSIQTHYVRTYTTSPR